MKYKLIILVVFLWSVCLLLWLGLYLSWGKAPLRASLWNTIGLLFK